MKSLVSRIVCLGLALTVICGSIGMATARQICLISGEEIKPLTEGTEDACCQKKKQVKANQKLSFKKKCCELSVAHFKVSAQTGNTFDKVKLPVLFTAPFTWFIHELPFIYNSQTLFAAGLNKTPPLAGRLLLAFIQIWQI